MKRITISLMTICLVLMLAQCRKVEVKPVQNDIADVELTEFSLNANSGGRTTLDGKAVKWSEGDKIYVVDMDATGSGLLGYLSAESGGTTSSTFSGSIIAPTAGHRCLFYYAGLNTFTVNNSGEYTYSVASQNGVLSGDSDLDIANRFQLLKSETPVTVTADMIKNHNFGSSSVSFKGMMAIAHLSFKVADEAYSGTVIVTGGYATATLNVKTGAWNPITGSITLNNANGDYYMAVIPENQNDGGSNQTLWFTTSGGKHCQQDNLPIAANKFYNKETAKDIDMYVPASALCGEFSLSATEKGYFSKGNLMYLGQAAEGQKWRFAEHQYDFLGSGPTGSYPGNVNLGSQYNGKYNTGSGKAGPNETAADKEAARDMFGWGTTGSQDTRSDAHANQINYQPYSTSSANFDPGISGYSTTFGYGPDYYDATKYNLEVAYKSDWGCIATLPDNSATNQVWRTLSIDEWGWIMGPKNDASAGFNCRTSSTVNGVANARFTYVKVNGYKGLLLFPDVFTWPAAVTPMPSNINIHDGSWSNVYSLSDFALLESAGAVFLPLGGRGYANSSVDGTYGNYWSSTTILSSHPSFGMSTYAYNILFYDGSANPKDPSPSYYRFQVRLVYQAQTSAGGTGAGDIGDGGNW